MQVRLLTSSQCELAVSIYPRFKYNASGGGGCGNVQHLEGGRMQITFDAAGGVPPNSISPALLQSECGPLCMTLLGQCTLHLLLVDFGGLGVVGSGSFYYCCSVCACSTGCSQPKSSQHISTYCCLYTKPSLTCSLCCVVCRAQHPGPKLADSKCVWCAHTTTPKHSHCTTSIAGTGGAHMHAVSDLPRAMKQRSLGLLPVSICEQFSGTAVLDNLQLHDGTPLAACA